VPSRDPESLLLAAMAGDRAALGRLISVVERGGGPARHAARLVFPRARQLGRVIGITGAPGAGKSTITDQVVSLIRADGCSVGVLAIDPSSPFSGGALLGDRVRMQRHSTDDGVFIRSMATRGHLGGLALATPEVVRVLAAVGLDVVVIETVGVGQIEVEVASNADTTVVVVNPGWGDAVQANKAGLLEIADVFVVNKADRPGAAQTRQDLAAMLDMSVARGQWRPPIVEATATEGKGMDELWAALGDHYDYLERSAELGARRGRRLRRELAEVLVRQMERDVRALADGRRWEQLSAEVTAGRIDPYEAAELLRAELGSDRAPNAPS
jgi:LAO/AO transport system kinase